MNQEKTNELLSKTAVICSACEGNGYTIEVEAECCWDADYIERYGSCCGIPNPVQVQVECRKCDNGYVRSEHCI